MTEVFLENKRLDLSEGLSNLLTYQLDDIKDIGSRNTAFSKTIVFPGTSNNNIQFGHIFDVRISNQYDSTQRNVGYNFNVTKQANCVIFQDHLQVFKGILRLNKMIILDGVCEYECTVFGELGGLISSIGNKKLEDLDFSVYDHVLSVANVTGSWDNFNATGYFYPLADYGNVSTNKVDYDIKAFRPGLKVVEYLDKIFTAAAYDYSCALFTTPRFKKLVVPNNQKGFQKLSSILFSVDRATQYIAISNLGPASPQNMKFVNTPVLGSFTANVDLNEFTYGGGSTLQTTFNIDFQMYLYGQGFTFTGNLMKNGVSIHEFFNTYRASAAAITFSCQIADFPVQVAPGDVFKIELRVINSGGIITYLMAVNEAVWDIRTPNDVYIDINLGDTITINDTIPRNILQRDFLVSILKLFNLYVYEDPLKTKFLNIKPYVDFYDINVSGMTDWTYKLDRSRAIELTPMSELNNRYYNFKFKQDSDYYNSLYRDRYNENYGDYLFDSQFYFTDGTGTIDVIFSGTPLVGYSGVDKIVSAYLKLNNNVEEQIATNIRIIQTAKITGVTSWAIKNGAATLLSGLTVYGYGGHYDDPDAPANDIHFGVPRELFFTLATGAINVHQFNVYWSSYMAEITDKDSKLLAAFFKLVSKDIFGLDFSKLVYVDGSYWRLNKIIDWNASEPDVCKVELLKVIILVY